MTVAGCRSYCAAASLVAVLAACGGHNGSAPPPATPIGPTQVPMSVVATATANDRLYEFKVRLTSLKLTNNSGKTVEVIPEAQSVEFMHLNGSGEPLAAASIPTDTYVAASAMIDTASFSCAALNTYGAVGTGTFATDSPTVTVNLPAPLVIGQAPAALLLDLQVAKSMSYTSCSAGSLQPWSLEPTFTLTTLTLGQSASSSSLMTNLDGVVSAVDGSAIRVTAADGPVWSIVVDSKTRYQGIVDLAALTPGAAVDMDATLQADGSLHAVRLAVADTGVGDLTMWRGPLSFIDAQTPVFEALPIETQGTLFQPQPSMPLGAWQLSFGSSAFRVSPQLSNLRALPFSAVFEGGNLVPGQTAYLTTHAAAFPDSPNIVSASTVTLLPQTLNGKVVAVSEEGGFTAYSVALAPYDLFTALAQQQGQATLLTAPGTLVVYTDSSTRKFNTTPLALGSVQRFRGLVFNDGGTLRMDCGWIFDGVAP
jgi:hypothetical protein